MKKLLSITVIVLMVLCLLTSCKEKEYNLNSTEREKVLSDQEKPPKIRPTADRLLGVYTLGKENGGQNDLVYKVYMKRYEDKLVAQVLSSDEIPGEVTADYLEKVTSEYDEKTGKFVQYYETTERTRVTEAYFSVEDGRIKIDLYKYYYKADGVPYEQIKNIGYKDTDNTKTRPEEKQIIGSYTIESENPFTVLVETVNKKTVIHNEGETISKDQAELITSAYSKDTGLLYQKYASGSKTVVIEASFYIQDETVMVDYYNYEYDMDGVVTVLSEGTGAKAE